MKLYSFDKSFKRLRKQKNLTQESFCPAFKEKTGISVTVTTVRNWEQGRSIPHLNDLIQLAAFFDVSVDYLLGLSDCTSVDNSYINKKTGEITCFFIFRWEETCKVSKECIKHFFLF